MKSFLIIINEEIKKGEDTEDWDRIVVEYLYFLFVEGLVVVVVVGGRW